MWGRLQNADVRSTFRELFTDAIDVVMNSIGPKAFRPERALNAAVFDSVMVGIARRLKVSKEIDFARLTVKYGELLADKRYQVLIAQSTSDEKNVSERLELATLKFAEV